MLDSDIEIYFSFNFLGLCLGVKKECCNLLPCYLIRIACTLIDAPPPLPPPRVPPREAGKNTQTKWVDSVIDPEMGPCLDSDIDPEIGPNRETDCAQYQEHPYPVRPIFQNQWQSDQNTIAGKGFLVIFVLSVSPCSAPYFRSNIIIYFWFYSEIFLSLP